MPHGIFSVQLGSQNGNAMYVEFADYFYLAVNDGDHEQVMASYPRIEDGKIQNDPNYFGDNGIVETGEIAIMDKIPQRTKDKGDHRIQVVMVTASTAYGEKTVFINGGDVSGHFKIVKTNNTKELVPYNLTDELKNDSESSNKMTQTATDYCNKFNLLQ